MNPGINYVQTLNTLLKPSPRRAPLVLDLFAGCGGLALGFEACGFETLGFEMDADCCATYRANLSGDCIQAKLEPGYAFPRAQVVIGGPPCQPFSVGGQQKGIRDARDGFPAFIAAVEQAQPDIWMFENVRGLMYRNKPYLDAILAELQAMHYVVEYRLLRAVEHGVPQNRERMIVVGHRGHFDFPPVQPHRVTAGEAVGDLIHLPDGRRCLTVREAALCKAFRTGLNFRAPKPANTSKLATLCPRPWRTRLPGASGRIWTTRASWMPRPSSAEKFPPSFHCWRTD